MTNSSFIPPTRKGRMGLALILLLMGGVTAWYFLCGSCANDPEVSAALTPPPAPAPVVRDHFADTLEVLTEEELTDAEEELEVNDAVSDATETRRPRGHARVCHGELETDEIREVVNGSAKTQVRSCYERRLRSDNSLEGTMNLGLLVDKEGKVKSVRIRGTLVDSEVHSCVRSVAQKWVFPPPRGSSCVRIAVPFNLTPRL